jgi:DNA-directed RNA polymerase beta subunit
MMNITANLPEIYEEVIETIRASVEAAHGPTAITCPATPSECMSTKKTYRYEFHCRGSMLFTLPKIVMEAPYDRRGYFIIDGIERFVMIQEIIRKNIFTLHRADDKVTCTIKLLGAYKRLEVVLKDCEFTINDSSLRNFMIGVPPMLRTRSIFETIQQYFAMMELDESVRKICLLYLSLGDTQMRPRELDENEIEPYFGKFQRESVIATLVYMAYLCTGCFIGKIPPTDLSSYQNKSFRSYPEMVHDAFFRIRNAPSLNKKLNDTLVTSIKTGVFEIFGRRYDNMVTTVSRRSPLDAISSVRKIIVPTDENTKNIEMRLIKPTTRMFVCPSETPEGRRVGLVKTLATNCVISRKIDENELIDKIKSLEDASISSKCVLINGHMHFFRVAFQQLLALKHQYLYLSVSKHHVIELRADGGRLMRPAPGGCMVDSMETAPDVDPSWMLGISASLIPLSEHNQCARAVFASSMLKQAMTLTAAPPNHVDHKQLLLAQTPLIYTRVGRELDIDKNGIHMTVAICTWLGFNQEDAIVMKKSFAERIGPLSKYVINLTVEMSINDKFIIQDNESGRYDKNGVIKATQKVCQNDPLVVLAVHTEGGHYQIKSHCWERDEDATVDDVTYGSGWIRFRMRIIRNVEIGDKLASRHAQKGILSVLVPDSDLPFDEDGNIPDIIINPHAIPSRMTIGQVIESQLSQQGRFVDGTIFSNVSKEIDSSCMKNMYDPFTGEMMKSQIHVGTVYYMFLAHQVRDKIHHRFYGDNSIFSNQPVSGRSRHGGLRIGEMEMDMLLTHGASQLATTVIKESDMTTTVVCKNCGYMLSSTSRCILCNSENVATLDIPFAFKNMANVLQIAGIKINALLTHN